MTSTRSRLRDEGGGPPLIIIQAIRTEWTKASRGGEGATHRNATPLALLLPASAPASPRSSYLLHTATAQEQEQFRVQSPEVFEQLPRTGPLRYGRLGVYPPGRTLRIVYHNPACVRDRARRAPQRPRPEWFGDPPTRPIVEEPSSTPPSVQDSLDLAVGQWLRVQYNWRYSHGYWMYEQWTFNVACIEHYTPDLFMATEPIHAHARLSRLA